MPIKTSLTCGAMASMLAVCLFPAAGKADTIFSLSNSPSSGTVTGTGTTETVSITESNLTLNGVTTPFNNFTETYSNATGLLTFSGIGVGPFANLTVAGSPFLSIQESMNLLGTLPLNAVNIYSGVTSVTFSSAFLTDLGLAGNPALSQVSANVSLTTSGSSVTSSVTVFDVASVASVPEPSTFGMLGMAMLLGIGLSARRKFGLNRSEK